MSEMSEQKTLGEIFSSYDFTAEEKSRIASLVKSGGLPEYILKKYAAHTEPFMKIFQKREKIPGFRPGSELYNKQAVQRLVHYLSDPKSDKRIAWDIYRMAAIAYVIKELPFLNKLVSDITFEGPDYSSPKLFTAICHNAKAYEVRPDDVKNLYNAWWTPRVENFEQLLTLCSMEDETSTLKRLVNGLLREIEDLRNFRKQFEAQITDQADSLSKTSNLASKDRERIIKIEATIQSLAKEVREFARKIHLETEPRLRLLEEKFGKFNERIKSIEQEMRDGLKKNDLKGELKKASDETRKVIKEAQETITNLLTKSIKNDIAVDFERYDAKLTSLAKEIAKKGNRERVADSSPLPNMNYKSPLPAFLNTETVSHNISGELDFINSWRSHLYQYQSIDITFEQAAAYHTAFLANRVVIAEYDLIKSWIHCLGWEPLTMHLVASPIWSGEEDWGLGAIHLFKSDSQESPQLLVIHNYDVGLVDSYLVPSLLLWSLQVNLKGIPKLFLIPSQQETPPNHQVLEHGIYIGRSDYNVERDLSFRTGIRIPAPLRQKIPTGVDTHSFLKWMQPHTQVDYDFTPVQKSLNLEISHRLVANFRNTVSLVARYLEEPFALGVGMCHQILPWVRSRYGESAYDELGAFLKQFPDIRY